MDHVKVHSPNPSAEVVLDTNTGRPGPLGVTASGKWKNFAVFADTQVTLLLFLSDSEEVSVEVPLHRTGRVWHVALAELPSEFTYAYRQADSDLLLLDPYATAVAGGEHWGELPDQPQWDPPWERVRARRSRYVEQAFDWGGESRVSIPMRDTVIYEVHLRGYTRNENAGVTSPGTYRGFIDRIPHLQELGVTTVEFMPVMETEENDNPRRNPESDDPLWNFWGYHPLSFFAPKASYASCAGDEIPEFRELVKALHDAGIEVILDVVYNHTGESDAACPTFSFRGLANSVYYARDPQSGEYCNATGCGNTFSTNHPVVQDLIIDSLRYWVTEMHVDGFRFDLASIFYRGTSGEPLHQPPIIERISQDPVLADIKLIAEPWDAVGLYHVGDFAATGRWSEWNDHFRDNVRRFVKSDAKSVRSLAASLSGHPDVYERVTDTINFVACHDGFTLADVVSFNDKHNAANGENGRDGSHNNHSWNCGVEGPTNDPDIVRLRQQQSKNLLTLLFMSQGVPMLLAGDEFGRTQHGNNNGYCLDSPQTWVDWNLAKQNSDLLRFCQQLIRFRRDHLPKWTNASDVRSHLVWHGCEPHRPDFGDQSRSLVMQALSDGQSSEVLVIANAFWESLEFRLPSPRSMPHWQQVIDTSATSPADFVTPAAWLNNPRDTAQWHTAATADSVTATPRSVLVFVARP